jgi:hypothetical protein
MRITISVVVCLIVLIFQLAYPAIPQTMSFQGILNNNSGHPVADSTYSVIFSIYNNPLNGNQLWSESQSVTTSNGLFNCILGNVHPIPDSAVQNPAFVGFGIQGQPEMSPRIALQSVPFAYTSNYSSNADRVDGYEAAELLNDTFIPPQNIFRASVYVGNQPTVIFTVSPDKIRYITNIDFQPINGSDINVIIGGTTVLHMHKGYEYADSWKSGGAPIVVGPNESLVIEGFANVFIFGFEYDYVLPRGR